MFFCVDVQILRTEYFFLVIVFGLWLLVIFDTLFHSFPCVSGSDVIFCALDIFFHRLPSRNFHSVLLRSLVWRLILASSFVPFIILFVTRYGTFSCFCRLTLVLTKPHGQVNCYYYYYYVVWPVSRVLM